MEDFKIGELVVYMNGDNAEIGKIKKLCKDGAFVYYHTGETAAKTNYENLFKLRNTYVIEKENLGGGNP